MSNDFEKGLRKTIDLSVRSKDFTADVLKSAMNDFLSGKSVKKGRVSMKKLTEHSGRLENVEIKDIEDFLSVASINEERGRIMLTRDTGNIVMPVESIETFLSEVVNYVNRHAGIEDLEQVDTAEIRENIGKTENIKNFCISFFQSDRTYNLHLSPE